MLDTNVLFAGLYSAQGQSHRLLRAIFGKQVRMVISTPLLFEYEDVLKRSQMELGLSEADIDAVLDNLCSVAHFQAIYFLWRPCLSDAKDDMVLELAVAARAPRLVTFNSRDFVPASRFGVSVVSPRQLLEDLK